MNKSDFFKPTVTSQLPQRVSALQELLNTEIHQVGADTLAARTGCEYHSEPGNQVTFTLNLWARPTKIVYPGWTITDAQTGQLLPIANQALLLYYFITADGNQSEPHWISFADLPDGRFYNQAFQGYTGAELARAFQNDLDAFSQAARLSGGELLPSTQDIPGDRAFIFQALPRVAVLVAYWQGDEDFPASAQLLFERSVMHYLPTDVCAILGSSLTHKLIKQVRQE